MIEEEEWGYLNDWEEDQLRKKRTKICMCCDHFRYACTVQCITLLTCPLHQKLIPQGDHLIKGCKHWIKRRELREGWCPEVAWNIYHIHHHQTLSIKNPPPHSIYPPPHPPPQFLAYIFWHIIKRWGQYETLSNSWCHKNPIKKDPYGSTRWL